MKFKVTGRFYLVLLLLALLIVYLFRGSIFSTSEVAVVKAGTASDVRQVQCVIVRDEEVVSESQVSRVDFAAAERSIVREGETCANVYIVEYSLKRVSELNETRKKIQEYHKILLGNEIDSELEVYSLKVNQAALELKAAVTGTTEGNILKLVGNLSEAMANRRAYMNANKRTDAKLMKYYDEESQKLNDIASNRLNEAAPFEGIVSFYLDGYESALNADTVDNLTIGDISKVLKGEKLSASAASARSSTDIFRVVKQDHWYIMLLANDSAWNPQIGQSYSYIVNGFDDIVYTGTVVRVKKEAGKVMAELEMSQPISSLLYTRSGTVTMGADLSGYTVKKSAIDEVNGQTGVWLYDIPGGTFIPVTVLATRSDGTVLFQPLVEGKIMSGSQVLIK